MQGFDLNVAVTVWLVGFTVFYYHLLPLTKRIWKAITHTRIEHADLGRPRVQREFVDRYGNPWCGATNLPMSTRMVTRSKKESTSTANADRFM